MDGYEGDGGKKSFWEDLDLYLAHTRRRATGGCFLTRERVAELWVSFSPCFVEIYLLCSIRKGLYAFDCKFCGFDEPPPIPKYPQTGASSHRVQVREILSEIYTNDLILPKKHIIDNPAVQRMDELCDGTNNTAPDISSS